MSHQRRVRDELVDVFVDVIRSSGRTTAPADDATYAEREARRVAERQEAMRLREHRKIRSYVGVGTGLLAGGVASMFLPTVAAVGVGFLAASATTMLVRALQTADWSALGRFSLSGKEPNGAAPAVLDPPEVNGRELPKSQRELVQRVLDDVATHLRRLDQARQTLVARDAAAAGSCARLVAAGGKLSDAVADAPGRLSCAQRAFTYFIPEAARVAEQMTFFAAQNDEDSLAEARMILARMELVLEKAMLAVAGVDIAEANVGMRLVKQALDEELNDAKTGK